VDALLKTGKHTVSAITRTGSSSKLPGGVQVKNVDYETPATLVEALRGQDALIITMAATAPPETEQKLVQAAAEANVPWILPNYWGSDAATEFVKNTPVGDKHKATVDLIEKLGKSSHISVHCGFWYEWSLPFPQGFGFDMEKHEVTLYGDGTAIQNTSTFPQVGRAVASLLSRPIHAEGPSIDKFKNGPLYITSFVINQLDMLESVLRVTGTTKDDWKITKVAAEERLTEGIEIMKTGDFKGFAQALYARGFFPDDLSKLHTERLSNEELGLPKEDLDEATKAAIARGVPI
jgi:hypothetical protein